LNLGFTNHLLVCRPCTLQQAALTADPATEQEPGKMMKSTLLYCPAKRHASTCTKQAQQGTAARQTGPEQFVKQTTSPVQA
jgi:hypothetical protein